MLCVKGIFNLKCLLIEFVTPNLSQIYFCIPEIFKMGVEKQFSVQNHLLKLFCSAVNFEEMIFEKGHNLAHFYI